MAKFSLVYNKHNLLNKPFSFYEYIAIFIAVQLYIASKTNYQNIELLRVNDILDNKNFEYIFNILSLLDVKFSYDKNRYVFNIKKVFINQKNTNEDFEDFFKKKKYNQQTPEIKKILNYFKNSKIKISFYLALIEDYYFVLKNSASNITNIDAKRNLSKTELKKVLDTYATFNPRT